MDLVLSALNAVSCGLISVALIWAVVSPKVRDGIIVKAGLIAMALGFGSISLRLIDGLAALDAAQIVRALFLVNLGLAVCILGYLVRRARAKTPMRRSQDWVDTDVVESE